jgi:hypothetical protein
MKKKAKDLKKYCGICNRKVTGYYCYLENCTRLHKHCHFNTKPPLKDKEIIKWIPCNDCKDLFLPQRTSAKYCWKCSGKKRYA